MEDPTMMQNIQDGIIAFLTGRAFLVATGVFLFYLFMTGMLRKIKNGIVGVFKSIFGVLSPFRMRRLFFTFLSLVFMTTSFALYSGAKAGLTGEESPKLHAIVGGSFAVGLWSVGLFISHLIREHYASIAPKKKKKPNKKVQFPTKKDDES